MTTPDACALSRPANSAARYVDDVILDAPYLISPEMIAALNISVVVTGKVSESSRDVHCEGEAVFAAAEAAGILKVGRL